MPVLTQKRLHELIAEYKSDLQKDNLEPLRKSLNAEEFKEICWYLQKAGLQVCMSLTEIPRALFQGNLDVKTIVIGNSVTSIGAYAFSDCTNLADVTMSNSVTNMGVGVFKHDTSLSQVTLSENIEEIPQNTFEGCSSIKKIYIPDKVTAIKLGAFNGCSDDIVFIAHRRNKTTGLPALSVNDSFKDFFTSHRDYGEAQQEDYNYDDFDYIENLQEDVNDRKPILDVLDNLNKELNKKHLNAYIDHDNVIAINIEWGDWKHEHGWADYTVNKFFAECPDYDVKDMWSETTAEDGSDTYSGIHYYELKEQV